MITHAIVLILLRFGTKFPQYHLKTLLLIIEKSAARGSHLAARKKFLMPIPELVVDFFVTLIKKVMIQGLLK